MRDIQMVLERWGAWAANEGGSVYYSPIAAGFKSILPFSGKVRPICSDDDGLIISSAMNALKKKDPYLCTLLELHYIHSISARNIAKRQGISHTQILKRLQKAEGFIDGCLSIMNAKLDVDGALHHG
ncbi:antitermination protein [Escherichia coli]|nr:antitermination protein [Escherichia coli]EHE4168908.1 antitermination protein [Escherichia coli]EHX8895043.1 antitermination protein [Escherichia coli]EKE5157163.1 antitermination protein [Escherichia coli]HBB2451191.1 antitermination protein [Escherichia coli]